MEKNLIDSINESKKNDFYRLLNGLGIRHIGVKTAKQLAKKFKNIDSLQNASVADLLQIDDMGEIMAQSIYDFFSQEQTKDLIRKLKDNGSTNISTKNTENPWQAKLYKIFMQ